MPFFANRVLDQGILIKVIDSYLEEREKNQPKRKSSGWNSPSTSLDCLREAYFSRVCDKRVKFPPRTIRIFENGHSVHERLQEYLKKSEILLIDEAIVFSKECQIHGRTDGIIKLDKGIGILEIKSMNSGQFERLTYADKQHEIQAMIYAYCINDILTQLKNGGRDKLEREYKKFISSYETDKDKISKRKWIFHEYLNILEEYISTPIDKVIILYENKDNQLLKEFIIEYDKRTIDPVLDKLKILNECVLKGEAPSKIVDERQCTRCKYKKECK